MKLKGKKAIITGGSQGIGKAIVSAFLREGASVLACARDGAALGQLAEEFKSDRKAIFTLSLDVSDRESMRRMIAEADAKLGAINILVNCAGIYGPIGPFVDCDLDQWGKTIEINLLGTAYAMQAVLPRMIKQGSGSIVNFSGGGAVSPLLRFTAYGSSKAAVVRLTETVAREVEELNVRINAIAPGAVNTRLLDQVLDAGSLAGADFLVRAKKQKETGGVPPDRAAELAVFLASDESAGLTGRLISAVWDDWKRIPERIETIRNNDLYTLRRIDEKLANVVYPGWAQNKKGTE